MSYSSKHILREKPSPLNREVDIIRFNRIASARHLGLKQLLDTAFTEKKFPHGKVKKT
ncbi:MAG: hypothetical protein WD048_15900 [Chitinophagales bacterium]